MYGEYKYYKEFNTTVEYLNTNYLLILKSYKFAQFASNSLYFLLFLTANMS